MKRRKDSDDTGCSGKMGPKDSVGDFCGSEMRDFFPRPAVRGAGSHLKESQTYTSPFMGTCVTCCRSALESKMELGRNGDPRVRNKLGSYSFISLRKTELWCDLGKYIFSQWL